ncbi:MAG: PIG-L deacetylase family protein [Roseibacillus sp.]
MNTQRLYRAARKLVRPLRRRLQSAPPPASLDDFQESSLVLVAHPDDEVFCSGLIRELLTRGKEVHLVCFTRGEGGERSLTTSDGPLGKIREQELSEAAKVLDVSSLTFLDFVDPASKDGQLSEPEHDSSELLAELENLIKKFSVTNLITHGSSGEYWHPAHLCLHRHSRILNRRLSDLQLWTFNAWTPEHRLPNVLNQDDQASLTFETSAHHKSRLQALSCHHSQRQVFERFAKGSVADFISLSNTESYRKW